MGSEKRKAIVKKVKKTLWEIIKSWVASKVAGMTTKN